ncbi:MAG: 50S ribosomal protein L6 [Candidatus Altiarchaeota archaeon]|nr:50S ribosomal protein L6 [Candidatus Altiarchaeota archaeon]
MEKKIKLPEAVTARVDGRNLVITGSRGELKRDFFKMPTVHFSVSGDELTISDSKEGKRGKTMLNTTVAHANNMIKGVTQGFQYVLDIFHVHFPIRVSVKGDDITINNFLGGKADVSVKKYPDVKVEVKGKQIFVEGSNLETVSQTAARIEQSIKKKLRNKDRRVFRDGLYIVKRGVMNE